MSAVNFIWILIIRNTQLPHNSFFLIFTNFRDRDRNKFTKILGKLLKDIT